MLPLARLDLFCLLLVYHNVAANAGGPAIP
jgi:hypothetical protein